MNIKERAASYIDNWQKRGIVSRDQTIAAVLLQEMTIILEAQRMRTLRAAATHLRDAMDDVERLSPEYADRLRVSDVQRLADELISFY